MLSPEIILADEVLELDYTGLMTPNQRRQHEKLTLQLETTFEVAEGMENVMGTEEFAGLTIDSIAIPVLDEEMEGAYPGVVPDNSIDTSVHRVTDEEGTHVYQICLPTRVVYKLTDFDVEPKGGKYMRGIRYVPLEGELTELEADTYVVTPRATYLLGERPVMVQTDTMRNLRDLLASIKTVRVLQSSQEVV